MSSTAEMNKVLGVCLAFISKEIQKQKTILEQELGSFATKDQLEIISEAVLSRAPIESVVQDLPEGLLFETHLAHFEHELRKELSSIKESDETARLAIREELFKLIESLGSRTEKDLSTQESNFGSRLDTLVESFQSGIQFLSEETNRITLAHSESKVALAEDIKARFDAAAESLLEAEIRQSDLVEKLRQDVVTFVKSVKDEFGIIRTDLTQSLKASEIAYAQKLEALGQRLDSDKKDSQFALAELRKAMNSGLAEKANRDHTHSEFAKVSHDHSQYAEKSYVEAITQDLESSTKKVGSSVSALTEKVAELLTKDFEFPEGERKSIVDEVTNAVQSTVRIPKDGKDAHDWEFKWHPKAQGTLGFKRDDWKEWEWKDLVPKIKQIQQPQYSAGMMGGVGSRDFIVVLKDGVEVSNRVEQIDFVGANIEATDEGGGRISVSAKGGTGTVETIVPGTGIAVDNTDPANPIVSVISVNRYTKLLSGFTVVIPLSEHGVAEASTVSVFNPSGKLVTTDITLNMSKEVTIDSNVLLDGHYAIIG